MTDDTILPRKKIAAIICTFQRYDVLPAAINSLLAQNANKDDFHIIVVDNSPRNPQQVAFQQKYHLHENIFYHIEEIQGLSNARNVGAKMGNSLYTGYIDDDAVASPNWITSMLEAFHTLSEPIGLVGGKVDPIWETERPDWLPTSAHGPLSIIDWGKRARILEPDEWIVGANFALVTSALQAVGGFDTKLGRNGGSHTLVSNEEYELRLRIEAKGYLTFYSPTALVSHHVPTDRVSKSWFRRRMAWQAVSEYLQSDVMPDHNLEQAWDNIESYFASLPASKRTVRGLFEGFDDPGLNQEQFGAVFSLMTLLLGGYEVTDV